MLSGRSGSGEAAAHKNAPSEALLRDGLDAVRQVRNGEGDVGCVHGGPCRRGGLCFPRSGPSCTPTASLVPCFVKSFAPPYLQPQHWVVSCMVSCRLFGNPCACAPVCSARPPCACLGCLHPFPASHPSRGRGGGSHPSPTQVTTPSPTKHLAWFQCSPASCTRQPLTSGARHIHSHGPAGPPEHQAEL